MPPVRFLAALLALAAATPAAVRTAPETRITAADILSDVRALSADDMGGRGPGTPFDAKARAYLETRLAKIGFAPGGPGGSWEQAVPLVGLTTRHPSSWTFRAGEREASFRWWDDVILASGVQKPHVAIDDAPVIFVGYGIEAPEFRWDDFKGADLKGAVLLMLNNDPDWDPTLFAGKKRLYYGRWDYKYDSAARHGAAGAIIIHTDASAGYPWQVVQSSWSGTQFELPDAGRPRVAVRGWITEAAAGRLAALAGKSLETLVAAARTRDFHPVPLGVTTSLAFDVGLERSGSANVIGVLKGSDPSLAAQAMVYTAHHDHLGTGEPDATGDRIYNGAVDNASGCAQVLAIARAFAATSPRPKRSIVALFVAAEEQGLLGSQYWVAHPTIPLDRVAADLNIDGGDVLGRTSDVAIVGRGKSSLEDLLAAAAAVQGRAVVDEPEPDKGYYYRSDQLSFARAGVPALYFKSGQSFVGRPEGWGAKKEAEYRRLHYHQPSDEIAPSWDLSGMVEDDRLAYAVGLAVANAVDRPRWRVGDEFEAVRERSLREAKAAR